MGHGWPARPRTDRQVADRDPQKPGGATHRGPRRPNTKPHSRRAVYGALDLGTNNCRLLVATPTRHGFRVIDAYSRIVKLGEGLSETGRLSESAMDRAIEALKVCAGKISHRRVTRLRSVATEACRLAENSSDFIDRVWDKTGIALDVISAEEEARLAVMGCQGLLARTPERALVFDIGGGSTELVLVRQRPGNPPEIEDWTSLPFGVIRLADRLTEGRFAEDALEAFVADIRTEAAAFLDGTALAHALGEGEIQLLGSSGTVTTLCSVSLGLDTYDRSKVDGAELATAELRSLARDIAVATLDERAAIPCIGQERAELIGPGGAILSGILSLWDVERITIADRGIREGILRALISLDRRVSPPPMARKYTSRGRKGVR